MDEKQRESEAESKRLWEGEGEGEGAATPSGGTPEFPGPSFRLHRHDESHLLTLSGQVAAYALPHSVRVMPFNVGGH